MADEALLQYAGTVSHKTSSTIDAWITMANPSMTSHARQTANPELFTVVMSYGIFFISGMAALIYEIVWVRSLTYTFGAGIYAVSAVLAAYMGGLALGAFAGGRIASRLQSPFRCYAALELLIGLIGVLMPSILTQLNGLDVWIVHQWGQNHELLLFTRFALALAVMVVPTGLMGATLPILSQALISQEGHLGRRVGGLYFSNTLGAMLGAFVGGFWLLRDYGIMTTEMTAVVLNLLAGAGGLLVGRRVDPASRPSFPKAHSPPEAPTSPRREEPASGEQQNDSSHYPLVLASVFSVGFVALAAQVLWSRSLIYTFDSLKSTTYGIAGVLTIFLGGIAVGSACGGWIADRSKNLLAAYGIVLCALAVSILLSVWMLVSGDSIVDEINPKTMTIELKMAVWKLVLKTSSVITLPTLLMGCCFPLAVKCVSTLKNVAPRIGGLYFANTTGAVAGSIAASFLIVPWFGLMNGLLVLGLLLGLVGYSVAFASRMHLSGQISLAACLVAVFVFSMTHSDLRLVSLREGESLVYYHEGTVATVSVIENEQGHRRINVDNIPVAGTSPIMQTDQKSLAHLPMAIVREPRTVLTVGFGSGGASWSYLLHDELTQVDCVEIAPEVVGTASYMKDANHGLLETDDPRYRIIFDDARAYLRYTADRYDIIATDCTDLRYKASANLYDLEYFRYCRERLRPNGVVVVWMPLGGLSDELFRTTLRTFHQAFPEMAVHYMHNTWTHYVLLVGGESLSYDFRRVKSMLEDDDVYQDLAEIGLDNPSKLLATFVTAGQPLQAMLVGSAVNTQDHPILEFEAPRYASGPELAQRNLMTLLNYRTSVRPWLVPKGITEEEKDDIYRFERAAWHIIRGQHFENKMQIEPATREYLTALNWTPEDTHVADKLEFGWLRDLGEKNNPTAWLLLGRSKQIRGQLREALGFFERYWTTLAMIQDSADPDAAAMREQAEAWRETAHRWKTECQALIPPKS